MDEEDAMGDNFKNDFGEEDDLVEICSYDDFVKNLKKYVDEEDIMMLFLINSKAILVKKTILLTICLDLMSENLNKY